VPLVNSPSKVMSLPDAVQRFVVPGAHLHFASTPSRANAAIRQVCRQFRGGSPGFTLSTTGFHSTAHLLALLRLGARYIGCFFGDNYPSSRPNPIYNQIRIEGASIEHWSLLSYVAALRAGAMGHPYGVTTSLRGTSLGEDLRQKGRFFEMPDPQDPARTVGMVAAMRPDVTFIHAPAADVQGRVLASAPFGEGFWGALGSKVGVIVTVEVIVDEDMTARTPDAVILPPHRVLAVCPSPYGAHPQPLYSARHLRLPGYPDDFEAYKLFREVAAGDVVSSFVESLLEGEDDYLSRMNVNERISNFPPSLMPYNDLQRGLAGQPNPGERLTILAARRIVRLVKEKGYRVILAGIGHAFFAARLAKLWLTREGIEVDCLVETGMLGFDCGPESGSFLLGYQVIGHSRRLSSIDDILGAIVCGADNHCLAVVGAAQVDAHGNINSTRLEDGTMLVGSGGANDIASSAAEVIVLASSDSGRLLPDLPYVTSSGRAVRHVVTEGGTLCRDDPALAEWRLEDAVLLPEDAGIAGTRLRRVCPWTLAPEVVSDAAPITFEERMTLKALDPERRNARRTG
jgi:acyl CoA:acetate/3-ketoacid CoA transferase beta subunit/acyl CoA:acetate/3-ketoacid CoA transferase alpha subunit